jgi:hypothetical protein
MTAVHSSGATDSSRERARVVQLHPPHTRVRKHQSHSLHQGERVWAETNCYVDLWIELLHGYGLDPRAALAFTVTQDFEGDQFTFFKFPLEDLEKLYGLQVQELAIYDSLEDRVRTQTQRGHTVLEEVDAFYLPDTRATSYRHDHTKTTIGVDYIDPRSRRLGYFHNTGYFVLDGEDYECGVLQARPGAAERHGAGGSIGGSARCAFAAASGAQSDLAMASGVSRASGNAVRARSRSLPPVHLQHDAATRLELRVPV